MDLYLALAANPKGQPNTAKTWKDVNPSLPAVPIQVYGPPSTSGTRDAVAELILAPVALVNPDPQLSSSVGLKQGSPLSPNDVTGPVSSSHMVTAEVRGAGNVPVPGATLTFSVLSGPNAGASGVCNPVSCVSGADGNVTWTYNGGPNTGTDHIQASIGSLTSNVLNKIWIIPSTKCDANNDGKVTQADLTITVPGPLTPELAAELSALAAQAVLEHPRDSLAYSPIEGLPGQIGRAHV